MRVPFGVLLSSQHDIYLIDFTTEVGGRCELIQRLAKRRAPDKWVGKSAWMADLAESRQDVASKRPAQLAGAQDLSGVC